MTSDFSPAVVDQRIRASIRPQLDRADKLLDYYTDGLPREVWEPIAFQVACSHYGSAPFHAIVGSFAEVIERTTDAMIFLAEELQKHYTKDEFVEVL